MYWVTGSASDAEEDMACILPEDLELPPFFVGERYGESWKSPKLKLTPGPLLDVISYRPGAVIVKGAAVDKLLPHVESEVEFLPLGLDIDEDLFVLNVTNVIDCLDMEKCEVRYHLDGKTLRTIRHYSFIDQELEGVMLFKCPQTVRSEVLCTNEFRQLGDALGLSGLRCLPLPQ